MKVPLIAMLLMLNTGCATVYTMSNADKGVVIKGSHCDRIPHVMSGTGHNICRLYGAPGDPEGANTEGNLSYLAVDSVFSLLADVIVLPYSLYKQLSSPPIQVKTQHELAPTAGR